MHADSLRHSLLRINTYRALASPAWISLTSPDPTLSAFQLSWELEHLALRENEFKDSYMQLSSQCKTYACQLLEQCRSSEEVIAVLNKVSGVCSARSVVCAQQGRWCVLSKVSGGVCAQQGQWGGCAQQGRWYAQQGQWGCSARSMGVLSKVSGVFSKVNGVLIKVRCWARSLR